MDKVNLRLKQKDTSILLTVSIKDSFKLEPK